MTEPTVVAAWIGFSATVFTGLVAVGGAVWVGLRQVRISKRQAEIADRQTNILAQQVAHADASNRIELFDRRMHTNKITKNYLMFFIYEEQTQVTIARDIEFLNRLVESRFLFDQSVYEYLATILERKNTLRLDFILFYSKAGEAHKERLNERITSAYGWAGKEVSTLHRVFAPFLDIAPPIPV